MKLAFNWKTSTAGVLALVTVALNVLSSMFDNDPTTIVNWGLVIPAVMSAVGLMFAKDGDKTGLPPA